MFGDALLESSPLLRRRKHWPMATAFTLELIVGSALVLLPLISTGVIPLTSHPPVLAPQQYIAPRTPTPPAAQPGGGGAVFQSPQVVPVASNGPHIFDPNLKPAPPDNSGPPTPFRLGPTGPPTNLFPNAQPVPQPAPTKHISVPMEARLINKVVPDYPRMARLSGVQGEVKLHAIIGKDGTIKDLTVTSGHPMLIEAAKQAVEQWKYRPYTLNGEPVEVETVITVSFKRY